MADKLRLGTEIRELKIGQSFVNPKSKAFHTMKYDFKPASVDTSKKATVEVPGVNQVTVTVPHLDGAGIPQTVFKGSQKPYTKECVLIIDRVTGEITLEKLSCNIQVKKTRSEYNKPHISKADRLNQQNDRSGSSMSSNSSSKHSLPIRSQTPPANANLIASGSAPLGGGVGHRVSNKTKVASGSRRGADRQITHLVPKHSPLHASPSYPSPGHPVKSPKRDLHSSLNESHNHSTLASLPMIGIDDFSDLRPPSRNAHGSSSVQSSRTSQHSNNQRPADKRPTPPVPALKIDNGLGEISDTTSSSSGSDSGSDDETSTQIVNKNFNSIAGNKLNGYSNGNSTSKIDTKLLNDDLCLSESGSDSD